MWRPAARHTLIRSHSLATRPLTHPTQVTSTATRRTCGVQVLTNAGALDRDRTWVLLTEAPEGGWGLHGVAHTNAELVTAARAEIAALQAAAAERDPQN